MLVEPDTGAGLGQDRCERGLADLQWHVVAVQLDQVEGVQEHVPVMLAVADTLERCEPVVIARDGFPIDDAGARAAEPRTPRSAGSDRLANSILSFEDGQ
jgi:hypothetical protein